MFSPKKAKQAIRCCYKAKDFHKAWATWNHSVNCFWATDFLVQKFCHRCHPDLSERPAVSISVPLDVQAADKWSKDRAAAAKTAKRLDCCPMVGKHTQVNNKSKMKQTSWMTKTPLVQSKYCCSLDKK